MKRLFVAAAFVGALLFSPYEETLAASVSQGVYHDSKSTGNGTVHELSINLNQPYTTVDLGLPRPITKRTTVPELARERTHKEHHVVGAVNASFFHLSTGVPSYLLMKNSVIHHLGSISSQANDFMYEPAAFGMLADNRPQIAPYRLSPVITVGNEKLTPTSYNRERQNDELIFYTSNWAYSHTRTNPFGVEVVVETPRSVNENVTLGVPIQGKVIGIRPYGQKTSAAVPANGRGFVLSATGRQASALTKLKKGDTVQLAYEVDERWKDARFMIASGPRLVQNGRAALSIDPRSPRATERTARTAVATNKARDRVFLVTVDRNGGRTGMTMQEFANYLVSIGAHEALNLDGGGSTTMVTRRYGDVYPTLTNKPMYGLRPINATLEAISTAPYGKPVDIQVEQAEKGKVAVGASVGFRITRAIDEYQNVLDPKAIDLQLKSATHGTIENNRFVATKPGRGTVVADAHGQTVRIPVHVTDAIDDLQIAPEVIYSGPNETVSLRAKAIFQKENVIFNDDAIQWTVSPNVGTLDGKVFRASNEKATGTLTASYGSVKKTIPVHVLTEPVRVGSFEAIDGFQASSERARAAIALERTIQPAHGDGSLRLDYDFTSASGTAAAYVNWKAGYAISGSPKAIGLWVYGNGERHWLRGTIEDGNGNMFPIDFTKNGGLDWFGWKYVEAHVPNYVQPMTLKQVYLVEPTPSRQTKGSILIDAMHLRYNAEPFTPPAFTVEQGTPTVDATKQWNVTFSQKMNGATIHNGTIYVERTDGTRHDVSVALTSDRMHATVSPRTAYEPGNYRLVVSTYTKNEHNVRKVKDRYFPFRVE